MTTQDIPQCNCAQFGNAKRCPLHTQEDFDAADRAIGRTESTDSVRVAALLKIIRDAYLYEIPTHSLVGVPEAILASEWLADVVAQAKAEALREAADAAVPTFNVHPANRTNTVADWLRARADREDAR